MAWYDFIWNYEPGGNVEHVEEHGLSPEDVEAVICNPLKRGPAGVRAAPSSRGIRPTDALSWPRTKCSTM